MFMLINALFIRDGYSRETIERRIYCGLFGFWGFQSTIDRNGVTKLSSFLHEGKGERCGVRKNEGR